MESILSVFRDGWCIFRLGNFDFACSYFRDTPLELIEGVLRFMDTKEPQLVTLDGEDMGFAYVMIDWVVTTVYKDKRHRFRYKYSIEDFAKQLYKDINEKTDDIINDFYWGLYGTKEQAKKQLQEALNKLANKFSLE